MSDIIGFQHWWNHWKDPKTSENDTSTFKTDFVTFIAVFSFWIVNTNTAQVPPQKEFLQKFEWLDLDLDESSDNTYSDSLSLKFCIQDFRGIAGLRVETDLDKITLKTLLFLCRPEKEETRYILAGSKWKSTTLTYRILSYPQRSALLGGFESIDREIKKAFAEWEKVTSLTFTQIHWYEADINIRFMSMSAMYGNGNIFDAPMARAFPPIDYGEIHFNDDYAWIIGSISECYDRERKDKSISEFDYPDWNGDSIFEYDDREWDNEIFPGNDIFQTAVHEIAHTLGLGHYQHLDSIMYPLDNGFIQNFKLHSDDIEAIQIIYGKKSQTTQAKKESEIHFESTSEINPIFTL